MCGRYFFQLQDHPSFSILKKLIEQQSLFEYAKEEVFPSQNAIVILANGDDYALDVMKWGIKGFQGKVLINARSETIFEKKTFQKMAAQRCLIPCNGFFEWQKRGSYKQKIFIHKKNDPLLYLAAIYNQEHEFVIVTGESENEMKAIHNRTPLLIKEDDITPYLQLQLEFTVDNVNLLFDDVEKAK